MDSPTPAPVKNPGRRTVLKALGAMAVLWTGAGLYPVLRYLSPAAPKDPFDSEGKAVVQGVTPADVEKPGMGKNGAFAAGGLMVLRDSKGSLRVYSSRCTHAGCTVEFEGDRIACHCHGGVYDLDGKNISGPPPKPLKEYPAVIRDGLIYVLRPSQTA